MKPKYTTYAELAMAFSSGELDRTKYFIEIDKSGSVCYLNYYNKDASYEENEKKQEECESIFYNDDDRVIDRLFELLGIPARWC